MEQGWKPEEEESSCSLFIYVLSSSTLLAADRELPGITDPCDVFICVALNTSANIARKETGTGL